MCGCGKGVCTGEGNICEGGVCVWGGVCVEERESVNGERGIVCG